MSRVVLAEKAIEEMREDVWGTVFQEKGTASAKALKQECVLDMLREHEASQCG